MSLDVPFVVPFRWSGSTVGRPGPAGLTRRRKRLECGGKRLELLGFERRLDPFALTVLVDLVVIWPDSASDRMLELC